MNQQAMSSVEALRICPVVGSYTSTPLISATICPFFFLISTSGSPKTMKRLPAPVFLSSSSPIARSGFILTGSTVSFAVPFRLFGDVRVEGEPADDEHVEAHTM